MNASSESGLCPTRIVRRSAVLMGLRAAPQEVLTSPGPALRRGIWARATRVIVDGARPDRHPKCEGPRADRDRPGGPVLPQGSARTSSESRSPLLQFHVLHLLVVERVAGVVALGF